MNIKEKIFPFLIAMSALSISASAAFYSITGLGKLFAGASTEVMIMTGSLEFGKLVIASLLYQYWNSLNKILKYYLSISVIILILITSMGIYGFLSSAYQDTVNKSETNEYKISYLKEKQKFLNDDLTRYDKELLGVSKNIETLLNAKTSTYQVRDNRTKDGVRTVISNSEIDLAKDRINKEDINKSEILIKRNIVSDSLSKINLAILEQKTISNTTNELGPLKYISELSGYGMNSVVNFLLLIIIFVFDPLAIALVISANFAFDQVRKKKNIIRENVTSIEETEEVEVEETEEVEVETEEVETEVGEIEEVETEEVEVEETEGEDSKDQIYYDELNPLKIK